MARRNLSHHCEDLRPPRAFRVLTALFGWMDGGVSVYSFAQWNGGREVTHHRHGERPQHPIRRTNRVFVPADFEGTSCVGAHIADGGDRMAALVGAARLRPGCGAVFGDVVVEMGVKAFGSCEELFAEETLETGVRGRHSAGRGRRDEDFDGMKRMLVVGS